MISDTDYRAWLIEAASAEKCVLVELEHSAGLLRLASRPYQTHPTDDPPSTPYDDWLTDLPELLATADSGMSAGDLEFICPSMATEMMRLHWRGRAARVYLGAVHWARSDYRLLVSGLIESVTRPSRDRIKVDFTDPGILLTRKVQTAKRGDITLPVCFGHVFNVAPVLLDAQTLEYAVHDGAIEAVTVRDNGVTVEITPNLATGTFTLNQSVAGEITAEVVQSAKTAPLMVAELARRVGVASAGVTHYPLPAAENGFYCAGGETYRDVLTALATSVGGVAGFDAFGALGLVCLAQSGNAVITLTEDDIVEGGIAIKSELPELSKITVKYQHNAAVLRTVAGSVLDNAPALATALQAEWSEVSKDNPANHYPELWRQETNIETLLINKADADSELNRFADWRFSQHFVYAITAFVQAVSIARGDRVRIIHPSWGLDNVGTVLHSEQRPGANRVELEVIL